MKLAIRYLKKYKIEAVLAPLFKMLEAIFELFVPLVMARIIDKGIALSDTAQILRCGLLLLALAAIGLICSVTAQFFSARCAVGAATDLRHDLFAHLQKFSFGDIDRIGTGTMITRMTSDVNQVQNGINMVLRLFLRSPFIVFGAMVMAFTIDVKSALYFVATIPLLAIVVFGIMIVTIPLYKKVQGGLDRILQKTRENLTGVRVIRAFAQEPYETEQFNAENDALSALQQYVGKLSALTNPVTFVIVNAATLALLYSGALRVDSGILTRGQVVALVNYMSQILVELVKLANLIVTITKALACASRIENVFDLTISDTEHADSAKSVTQNETDSAKSAAQNETDSPAKAAIAPGAQEAVAFDHVCLSYNGGEEALTDINLHVRKGQTIGIIGGTGSGKTSLVHLIPRFYDATKGNVLIDGMNVKNYDPEVLRRKIGIVLQKAVLFQGTIADNLRFGNEGATEEEMIEALKIAQAFDFVEAKEGKLQFEVAQGGKNLSGGQRQRLTIARALVRKPEILILDDSASALDYATDALLRKALKEMPGDQTVFIVSQRTSSLQHADQILVLEDGDVAGLGTHEELLKNCHVYREIYESQFKNTGSDSPDQGDPSTVETLHQLETGEEA